MQSGKLRKLGDTIKLAIAPALLDIRETGLEESIGTAVEDGRLDAEPHRQPRYTMAELLAQCNPEAPLNQEDSEWIGDAPTGGELI